MATIPALKPAPHPRIEHTIIDNSFPKIGPYGYTGHSVIKRHFNQKTLPCNPSYATKARKSGMDRSTVIRYVNKLKALNLLSPPLRFKEDGSPTSNQSNFHGAENAPSSQETALSGQIRQGGRTEPPPIGVQDDSPSRSALPEPGLENKKERTIVPDALQPSKKQQTCPHPPTEIIVLPDNITICNHCFSLLTQGNTSTIEETNPTENVSAA